MIDQTEDQEPQAPDFFLALNASFSYNTRLE